MRVSVEIGFGQEQPHDRQADKTQLVRRRICKRHQRGAGHLQGVPLVADRSVTGLIGSVLEQD